MVALAKRFYPLVQPLRQHNVSLILGVNGGPDVFKTFGASAATVAVVAFYVFFLWVFDETGSSSTLNRR